MAEYECLDDMAIETACENVQSTIDEAQLERQTKLFKVLGDLNRVKIMHVLSMYDRLCVYEISRLIGASVATTSHHLITLRKNGIIHSAKDGKHVIYSLETQLIGQFIALANQLQSRCPKCGKIHQ